MTADWGDIGQTVPIDVLTDDVLLHIFDFCFPDKPGSFIPDKTEVWQELAHVCRRWRELCFSIITSPRSATFVHNQNTCGRYAEYLACPSFDHTGGL
jgi:hypothetical protein